MPRNAEGTIIRAGRPRVGQPISITLTDEQRAWVDENIPPGGTRTQVIRGLVQAAMDAAPKKKRKKSAAA